MKQVLGDAPWRPGKHEGVKSLEQNELERLTVGIGTALGELLEVAQLKAGQILVVGCSTSEIQGERIGRAGNMDIAGAVYNGIMPRLQEKQIFLAVQGCEHINRALVVEEECAEKYNLEIVNVVPHLRAGGGFATYCYEHFQSPVMVESIAAHAGIDIGDTFIGMHLRQVAVPVRVSINTLGHAHLSMARTRPRLIGGERARYIC